jgi:hypothetical protein
MKFRDEKQEISDEYRKIVYDKFDLMPAVKVRLIWGKNCRVIPDIQVSRNATSGIFRDIYSELQNVRQSLKKKYDLEVGVEISPEKDHRFMEIIEPENWDK